ncbi:MAG: O-antigen ligase family protein, partial [Bacteroidales bacterium]
MKKTTSKSVKTKVETIVTPPLNYSYVIILIAYTLITVLTPNLKAWDANGPKFLFLSLLNLLSFLFLIGRKEMRTNPTLHFAFFRNKIGLVYTLFMIMVLISFTKAINISESILSFSKYFTVFCMTYILSILFRFDRRYLRMVLIVMTVLLIADSFTVFYNILLYITKQVDSIYEIKSVYANKNVLAAAIFVKIPFALWLATFEKQWLKKLGFVTLFFAELAIFFMSTRAFYLGLIFLALIYGAYLLIIFLRDRKKTGLKTLSFFFGSLLIAFLFFSFTQHFLYPKKIDIYNKSYTERLSTITSGEAGRLESWKRSALLFKQDPLLGVGTGNWKIQV